MPILDLVTPWAAAARAADPTEIAGFLRRHADLLEPIRRQRSPTEPTLPPPSTWSGFVALAGDDHLHQLLRDARDRLVDRGLTAPRRIVLLATAAPGGAVEVLPEPGDETLALFVDRVTGRDTHRAAQSLAAALAAGMAALTRWTTPDNPVATVAARGGWDRWVAAREAPLAEWVYAAGLGVHAALLVTDSPATALGISDGELRRLREGERALQSRLDAELDRTGMGLVLRWLEDGATGAMRRTSDGAVIPAAAGRYLGWRMLDERVARLGVAEAARMAV